MKKLLSAAKVVGYIAIVSVSSVAPALVLMDVTGTEIPDAVMDMLFVMRNLTL